MRVLYPVFRWWELAAGWGDTTAKRRREDIARPSHHVQNCLSTPCSAVVFLVLSWYGHDTL
jgi:hypothetical protein